MPSQNGNGGRGGTRSSGARPGSDIEDLVRQGQDRLKRIMPGGGPRGVIVLDPDERRGMAAQKSTEIRRRLHEVQADRSALRRRPEELERLLLAVPAETRPEAAAKAQYLIQLFAATREARDPRP